jgi:hypothetical protein
VTLSSCVAVFVPLLVVVVAVRGALLARLVILVMFPLDCFWVDLLDPLQVEALDLEQVVDVCGGLLGADDAGGGVHPANPPLQEVYLRRRDQISLV